MMKRDSWRTLPDGMTLSRWRAPDGWELRRFAMPPAENSRPRGSLLFLGGRGDFIEKYLEIYAHFHRAGWRVEGFDWRGQGESGRLLADAAIGHAEDFTPLVNDLAAILHEMRTEEEGPLVAIGHSMGGHLLLRYLIRPSPVVDAAVLVAPMLGFAKAPPPAIARWIAGTACALGLGRRVAWREKGAAGDALRQRSLTNSPERYADELWWRDANANLALGAPSWGWLRAAFASNAMIDRRGVLERVRVPVLLIEARQDQLVSGAAIARAAARLPDAALESFDDGAHELLRERDPVRDRALALIDSFFEERAPAP